MKKAKICLLYLFVALYFITSISFVPPALAETAYEFFTWDNATVYFVMTDRFVDGDTSNNHSYGRELDRYGNPYPDY